MMALRAPKNSLQSFYWFLERLLTGERGVNGGCLWGVHATRLLNTLGGDEKELEESGFGACFHE